MTPLLTTSQVAKMKVEYFHEIKGKAYGNIIWQGKFPMRGGQFPVNHPCKSSSALNSFRSKGYWASCFPEGDGITMKTNNGQNAQQVAKDITDCFGWEVTIRRS